MMRCWSSLVVAALFVAVLASTPALAMPDAEAFVAEPVEQTQSFAESVLAFIAETIGNPDTISYGMTTSGDDRERFVSFDRMWRLSLDNDELGSLSAVGSIGIVADVTNADTLSLSGRLSAGLTLCNLKGTEMMVGYSMIIGNGGPEPTVEIRRKF